MTATPTPPSASEAELALANDLHARFCSDVPNDGTYTLHLNETETIRFFAELERMVAANRAAAVAEAVKPLEAVILKHQQNWDKLWAQFGELQTSDASRAVKIQHLESDRDEWKAIAEQKP